MNEYIKKARKLRPIIEQAATSLDDNTALEAVDLYPSWSGKSVIYKVGVRVRYNGILYKVLADHTSQETWTPDAAPSLFAEVLVPVDGSIPEWKQPDSTNPYMNGDKVTHNGSIWMSDVDNNVWEPGTYGWTVV